MTEREVILSSQHQRKFVTFFLTALNVVLEGMVIDSVVPVSSLVVSVIIVIHLYFPSIQRSIFLKKNQETAIFVLKTINQIKLPASRFFGLTVGFF